LEGSPDAISEAEDEEECVEVSATVAEKDHRVGHVKRGLQFMAIKELMICKAYIKASEDSIHGSKQKIALFKMQLLMTYKSIKADQEEEGAHDAAKPSHLKPSGCNLIAPVVYPECTGSSLHQHFTKKILPAVIKYMSVATEESI